MRNHRTKFLYLLSRSSGHKHSWTRRRVRNKRSSGVMEATFLAAVIFRALCNNFRVPFQNFMLTFSGCCPDSVPLQSPSMLLIVYRELSEELQRLVKGGANRTCMLASVSVYLSVCLSVCLSVGLSVCLSVCLSNCLSAYESRFAILPRSPFYVYGAYVV